MLDRSRLFNSNQTFGYKNIIWDYAEVVDINDPYDAGRIKVRIPVIDNVDTAPQNQLLPFEQGGLPWCEPLLPKYLNVVPELGQLVKIIVFNTNDKKMRRQYVGPVIGQQTPQDLLNSTYDTAKIKVESSGYVGRWSDNPASSYPEKVGDWKIYPNKTDIAFLGKKNTDIILRNKGFFDEIQLRAGKIKPSSLNSTLNDPLKVSPVVLNTTNPGYITINFTEASALPQESVNNIFTTLNIQKDRSHVNIVADHINFISHLSSGTEDKILQGQNIRQQINLETTKLHPVVYGDVLWDFMSLMRNYVEGHIHKGSRREPDGDRNKNDLINWFNKNMGVASSKPTPDGNGSYVEINDCNFLSKGVKTN